MSAHQVVNSAMLGRFRQNYLYEQLSDPFDPVQALPKAAEYLRELVKEFGNPGLAAAAYNAGPQRVREWLMVSRPMPAETRRYVQATGRSVEQWAETGQVGVTSSVGCLATLASLDVPPSTFANELQHSVANAAGKPWSVELAAGFSRESVLSAYARALHQAGDAMGHDDPIIISTILRSRGTTRLYQAYIGAESRRAAEGICLRLRHSGVACIVLRISHAVAAQLRDRSASRN